MKYFGSITDAKDLVTKEYVDNKMPLYGTCSAATAKCSAASKSLSASTVTALTLDTWVCRTNTEFTFNGGSIVCPYDGIVMVSGSVYINYSGGNGGCYIKHNGTEIANSFISGVVGATGTGVKLISVSAGDTLTLCARRSTAGSITTNSDATYLTVVYVQQGE